MRSWTRQKTLVNVNERDLQKSISADKAKLEGGKVVAEVGPRGIHYAAAQEFGPYGKPYLRPALQSEVTLDKIVKRSRK